MRNYINLQPAKQQTLFSTSPLLPLMFAAVLDDSKLAERLSYQILRYLNRLASRFEWISAPDVYHFMALQLLLLLI